MFGHRNDKSAQHETAKPVVAVNSSEWHYMRAWGYTEQEWLALTIEERRDYRDRVAYAPLVKEAN